MKTLLLIAIVSLGACAPRHTPTAAPRAAVSSAQTPECKEIPTFTGKPSRCAAVPPDSIRAQ